MQKSIRCWWKNFSNQRRHKWKDTSWLWVERAYIFLKYPFLVAQTVKASAYNAGDLGSIHGSGRSLGEGNGNPLLYPCLGNPIDRGAWRATVHGVEKRVSHNLGLNYNSNHREISRKNDKENNGNFLRSRNFVERDYFRVLPRWC